jgi:hypothetical protein
LDRDHTFGQLIVAPPENQERAWRQTGCHQVVLDRFRIALARFIPVLGGTGMVIVTCDHERLPTKRFIRHD